MCIEAFLPNKDRDRIINGITRDGKKVYKIVRVIDEKYYPLFNRIHEPYNEGVMEADQEARSYTGWGNGKKEYKAGFHFWLHREDADICANHLTRLQKSESNKIREQFRDVEIKVITCIVKKYWVNVLGRDETCEHTADALVAKKAIFPKYRK